ncbi:hypothetical protein HF086_009888 [Spodoptera exigua]|uniref:Uncharacterized protein n=1 Tax=Spodoptera exigua TaxID=7107 RepID=A0A922S9A3_SPOEX|nr:hypothetical protein HF086_009888 [Spodoptera exigua]
MVLKILIIIASLLSPYVVSDTCVTYDFEENFDDIIGNHGICSDNMMSEWILDEYNNLGLNSPHERSTKFISPTRGVLSCWSSFLFTMSQRGTLQVKLYMTSDFNSDFLQILVFSAEEYVSGMYSVTSSNVKGWYTANLPLEGNPAVYRGYVSHIFTYIITFRIY